MSFTDSLAVLNSSVRTLLALLVVGGVGAGSWFGYQAYDQSGRQTEIAQQRVTEIQGELDDAQQQLKDAEQDLHAKSVKIAQQHDTIVANEEQIDVLEKDVEEKQQEITRLDTALHLLKIDHRVARLTVIDQQTDGDTGKLTTLVEFVEVDDEGRGIDEPKKFRIMGDVVYVDNWVVKFDDKYVETADIERSTSLVLFRRIFGEFQEPNEGFAIDEIGARPRIYSRGSMTTELERRIWNDFWNIANDRERATELGIRAAHGEAVSIKLQRGKAYRLMLRASDGLSIQPAGDAPKPPPTT